MNPLDAAEQIALDLRKCGLEGNAAYKLAARLGREELKALRRFCTTGDFYEKNLRRLRDADRELSRR